MALEDLIGNIYQQNMQLPIAYGGLYNQAYSPYYQYLGNQANNQTSLGTSFMGQMGNMGSQSMGLYGQLSGQQSDMYRSELPIQFEEQKYNSLAPVLSGLLGQFEGFGNIPAISGISMKYDRPNVMAGYQGAVDRAYGGVQGAYDQSSKNAGQYDQEFRGAFGTMMDRMPAPPWARSARQAQRAPDAYYGGSGGRDRLPPAGGFGAAPRRSTDFPTMMRR